MRGAKKVGVFELWRLTPTVDCVSSYNEMSSPRIATWHEGLDKARLRLSRPLWSHVKTFG